MFLFKNTDTARPAFIIEAITKTRNNRETHKLDKTKNTVQPILQPLQPIGYNKFKKYALFENWIMGKH